MLQTKLPEDDFQALEELLELYCESSVLEACASFEYGFKLGALIRLEVLDGKGELTAGKIKIQHETARGEISGHIVYNINKSG